MPLNIISISLAIIININTDIQQHRRHHHPPARCWIAKVSTDSLLSRTHPYGPLLWGLKYSKLYSERLYPFPYIQEYVLVENVRNRSTFRTELEVDSLPGVVHVRVPVKGFRSNSRVYVDSIAISVFVVILVEFVALSLSIRRQGPNNYSDTVRLEALSQCMYKSLERGGFFRRP